MIPGIFRSVGFIRLYMALRRLLELGSKALVHFFMLRELFRIFALYCRLSSCTVDVPVYLDDISATGSEPQSVCWFLDQLCSTFDSWQMKELNFFLGIEINNFLDNLFLSQTRYAVNLLKRFNMTKCKPCPILLPSNTRLSCMYGYPLFDLST